MGNSKSKNETPNNTKPLEKPKTMGDLQRFEKSTASRPSVTTRPASAGNQRPQTVVTNSKFSPGFSPERASLTRLNYTTNEKSTASRPSVTTRPASAGNQRPQTVVTNSKFSPGFSPERASLTRLNYTTNEKSEISTSVSRAPDRTHEASVRRRKSQRVSVNSEFSSIPRSRENRMTIAKQEKTSLSQMNRATKESGQSFSRSKDWTRKERRNKEYSYDKLSGLAYYETFVNNSRQRKASLPRVNAVEELAENQTPAGNDQQRQHTHQQDGRLRRRYCQRRFYCQGSQVFLVDQKHHKNQKTQRKEKDHQEQRVVEGYQFIHHEQDHTHHDNQEDKIYGNTQKHQRNEDQQNLNSELYKGKDVYGEDIHQGNLSNRYLSVKSEGSSPMNMDDFIKVDLGSDADVSLADQVDQTHDWQEQDRLDQKPQQHQAQECHMGQKLEVLKEQEDHSHYENRHEIDQFNKKKPCKKQNQGDLIFEINQGFHQEQLLAVDPYQDRQQQFDYNCQRYEENREHKIQPVEQRNQECQYDDANHRNQPKKLLAMKSEVSSSEDKDDTLLVNEKVVTWFVQKRETTISDQTTFQSSTFVLTNSAEQLVVDSIKTHQESITSEDEATFHVEENIKGRKLWNSTEYLDANCIKTGQGSVTSASCDSAQRDSVASVVSNLPKSVCKKKQHSCVSNNCHGVQRAIEGGCEVPFISHDEVEICMKKTDRKCLFSEEDGRTQVHAKNEQEKQWRIRPVNKPQMIKELAELQKMQLYKKELPMEQQQQKQNQRQEQRLQEQKQKQQQQQQQRQKQQKQQPHPKRQHQQKQDQERRQQQQPQKQQQQQQKKQEEQKQQQEIQQELERPHEQEQQRQQQQQKQRQEQKQQRQQKQPKRQKQQQQKQLEHKQQQQKEKQQQQQQQKKQQQQQQQKPQQKKKQSKQQKQQLQSTGPTCTNEHCTLGNEVDSYRSSVKPQQVENEAKGSSTDESENLTLRLHQVPQSSTKAELEKFIVLLCEGVKISKLVKAEKVYILELNTKEDCKKVYDSVRGTTYKEQKIKVTWAGQFSKKREEQKPYVVVSNLNPKFEEKAVRHFFNRCQGITSVEKKTNEPHARVHFKTFELAEKAVKKMNGFEVNGKTLGVSLGLEASKEIRNKQLDDELKTFTTDIEKKREDLLRKNVRELEHLEKLMENLFGTRKEKKKKRKRRRKKNPPDEFKRQAKERENYEQKREELQRQRGEFEKKFRELFDSLSLEAEERRSIGNKSGIKGVIDRYGKAIDRELKKFDASLPIYAKRSEITETVRKNQVIVLIGETGSGKSTQLAQYLADDSFRQNGTIVVTQPRKIAAMSLAKRVAQEYGCSVGKEVGYHVGLNRKANRDTIIKFVTDRILVNEVLKGSESMKEYSCIIIDEAHERSIHTDLLLAMIKQHLPQYPNLKLIITSATLNTEVFRRYFNNCPIVEVRGRAFPVERVHERISTDDYVNAVLEKAVDVCQAGEHGDILIFLTQQNEIEQTCDKLKKRLGDKSNVILPLHGKLQPEDQEQVFKPTPDGKRKIVVATNSAETSITIDGIRIVIDSGMVKEPSFDPARNMTTLDVKMVSRSSAFQRSGRAGRTGPGKCYCMYTIEEFNNMEQDTKPEILKMHLGMAVLQLLSLGVTDVEQFDFVEAPPRESLLTALASLKQLGAVDQDGTMSDLGRQMLELPTEPRLSKALLEGLERGCGEEIVAMVALMSSGRDVFYRGDTAEKKDECAIQKQEFCKTSGDLQSALDVYREWSRMPPKQRNNWCMENALNAKTLRSTRETIDEIKDALKKVNQRGNLVAKLEITSQNLEDDLRKSLLAGFSENVAWSRGHEKVGYTVVMASQDAKIHPSSVLSSLGCQPEWILFQEMRRTTDTFLVNIIPIEKEWLAEVAMHTLQFVDEEEINRSKAVREKIKPLGPALVKSVIGLRGSNLRQIESSVLQYAAERPLANSTAGTAQPRAFCVIECNVEQGFVDIYTPVHCKEYAKIEVTKVVENKRCDILDGGTEIVISKSGFLKAFIGNDMKTKLILQPKESCKFDVFVRKQDETCEVDPEDVLTILIDAGEVIHYSLASGKNSRNVKWGTVTYCDPREAREAWTFIETKLDEEELPYNVQSIQLKPCRVECLQPQNTAVISGIRVLATWYPFPSANLAFIKCTSPDAAKELLCCLNGEEMSDTSEDHHYYAKSLAFVSKKTGDIALRIGPKEDETTVLRTIRASGFQSDAHNPCQITVPSQRKEVDLKLEKRNLMAVMKMFENIHLLDLWIGKCQKVMARLVFVNIDDAKNVIGKLNEKTGQLGARAMYLELEGTSQVTCNKRLYEKLNKTVENIINEHKGTTLEEDDLGRRGVKITVTGDDPEVVQTTGKEIADVIAAETITIEDLAVVRSLSSGYGRDKLKKIEKSSGAFVQSSMVGRRIQITGPPPAKEQALKLISELIKELQETRNVEILLRGADSPVGAIRELLKKYGKDLKGLVQDEDCQAVIDVRRRKLVLKDSEDGVRDVREKAEIFLQGLRGTDHSVNEENDQCPVCLSQAEQPYRLNVCGHAYCSTCIDQYITATFDSERGADMFPQKCVYDSCEDPLTNDDYRAFLMTDQLEQLYRISFESFVIGSGKYKFCPSPDCSWVYECTSKPKMFDCPECGGQVCQGCGNEPHMLYDSCEAYKASKDPSRSDELYKKWAARADTRQCPKCSVMIEKNKGCSHVKCTQCRAHICWKCGKWFTAERPCYDHISDCRR